MDLSLAKEVDRALRLAGLENAPVAERLAFLGRAEAKALAMGDQGVLRALAVWRVRRQIIYQLT